MIKHSVLYFILKKSNILHLIFNIFRKLVFNLHDLCFQRSLRNFTMKNGIEYYRYGIIDKSYPIIYLNLSRDHNTQYYIYV